MKSASLLPVLLLSLLSSVTRGRGQTDCTEDAVNECLSPLFAFLESVDKGMNDIVPYNQEQLTEVCRLTEELKTCLDAFRDQCDVTKRLMYEGVESSSAYGCNEFGWDGYSENNECFESDKLEKDADECGMDEDSWYEQLAATSTDEKAKEVKQGYCKDANEYFKCLTEALYGAEECKEEGISYQLIIIKKNKQPELDYFDCTVEEQCSVSRLERCTEAFLGVFQPNEEEPLAVRTSEQTDAVCPAHEEMVKCMEPLRSQCGEDEDDALNTLKGITASYEYFCEKNGKDVYKQHSACITDALQKEVGKCQDEGWTKLAQIQQQASVTPPAQQIFVYNEYCSTVIDMLLDCVRYAVEDVCGEEMAEFQYAMDSSYWGAIYGDFCDVSRCSPGRVERCYDDVLGDGISDDGVAFMTKEQMDNKCEQYTQFSDCIEPIRGTCDVTTQTLFKGSEAQGEYLCEDGGKEVYLAHSSCLNNDDLQGRITKCKADGDEKRESFEPKLQNGNEEIFRQYCSIIVDDILNCTRILEPECGAEMAKTLYKIESAFWRPVVAPIGCDVGPCFKASYDACFDILDDGVSEDGVGIRTEEQMEKKCELYSDFQDCIAPFKDDCIPEVKAPMSGVGLQQKYICQEGGKDVYLAHSSCLNDDELQNQIRSCKEEGDKRRKSIEPGLQTGSQVVFREYCEAIVDMMDCYRGLEPKCDPELVTYQYTVDSSFWTPVVAPIGCDTGFNKCTEKRTGRCMAAFYQAYSGFDQMMPADNKTEMDNVCRMYQDAKTCRLAYQSTCYWERVNEFKGLDAASEYFCSEESKIVYLNHSSCLTEDLREDVDQCQTTGDTKFEEIGGREDTVKNEEDAKNLRQDFCDAAEEMINCFTEVTKDACGETMADYKRTLELAYWREVMEGYECDNDILKTKPPKPSSSASLVPLILMYTGCLIIAIFQWLS